MPEVWDITNNSNLSTVELPHSVKTVGIPYFWVACIPISSQLNIQKWEELLRDYWDQHLIQLLKFGFPAGFNRNCSLCCTLLNHRSAIEYLEQVQVYTN